MASTCWVKWFSWTNPFRRRRVTAQAWWLTHDWSVSGGWDFPWWDFGIQPYLLVIIEFDHLVSSGRSGQWWDALQTNALNISVQNHMVSLCWDILTGQQQKPTTNTNPDPDIFATADRGFEIHWNNEGCSWCILVVWPCLSHDSQWVESTNQRNKSWIGSVDLVITEGWPAWIL